MKEHTEKRASEGLRLLLQTLTRNFHDTGILLDEFEETHDEIERDRSRLYSALVEGHFALKDALEKINNQLNKK